MARGGRLPRTAGRPPRFLRTGHRRATSLSEAHLQAARRDAGHTLGREAEGVLQSLLFHRASRGLRAQKATFRVLAEGDPDVDAALASAVGCSPPPRSLTPPRPPLSDQRGRAARLRRCPDCPKCSSPGGAGEAAALVLATREFVANGGGRPSDPRRWSAASPRWTGGLWPCWSAWAGGVPTRNSRRQTSEFSGGCGRLASPARRLVLVRWGSDRRRRVGRRPHVGIAHLGESLVADGGVIQPDFATVSEEKPT